MSISAKLVEQGGVYRGAGGQKREVVAISGRLLTYRLLTLGTDISDYAIAQLPEVGETKKVTKQRFAEWALSEVA